MQIGGVNDWIARIDTGYSLEEFKRIVTTMYGDEARHKDFGLYLFEGVKQKDLGHQQTNLGL